MFFFYKTTTKTNFYDKIKHIFIKIHYKYRKNIVPGFATLNPSVKANTPIRNIITFPINIFVFPHLQRFYTFGIVSAA